MKRASEKGVGLGTMTPEMQGAVGYYDWIADALRPYAGRRILEIGPGFGDLAERLGTEAYAGLDSSPEVVEHLAGRFRSRPSWRFLVDGALGQEHHSELKAMRLDTVLAVNLLEHLPDEAQALSLWRELCPGGRLLLLAPALPALYGSLDEQAGHYRRYTRDGMGSLLEKNGVRVEALRYFNALGALGWWVSARVLRQDLAGRGAGRMVTLYHRFVLPLARLSDPLLRPFWGQSVLAVGRFL